MVAILYGSEFKTFIVPGKNEYVERLAIQMPSVTQNWLKIFQ